MKRKFLKSNGVQKLTVSIVAASFVFWTFLTPLTVCFCDGCACGHNISAFFPVAEQADEEEKSCCCEKECCGSGKKTPAPDSSGSGCQCGCGEKMPVSPPMISESPARKIVHGFAGFPILEMPLPMSDSLAFCQFSLKKQPGIGAVAPPVRLHLLLSVFLN